MKVSTRQRIGRPALDVIEDAVHLLREAPLEVHLAYLVGTAPFLLALLWFWADMTRGAFADARCAPAALGLAALFLWMKTWHSVFAARLAESLLREPRRAWSLARWLRILTTQAAIQSWGLILLPLSVVLLMVPTPWVFAIFQSATTSGDTANGSAANCLRRALRNGWRWPGQNHAIFGLLILVSFGVILNVGVAVGFTPKLVRTFSGFENEFTLSVATIFNTTFLLGVLALSYLVLDPVVKSVYVIRCFEGEALSTGDDLRAGLKHCRAERAAALAMVLMLLTTLVLPGMQAADPAPPPASAAVRPLDLDRALREVLERPDYTWRAPRQHAAGEVDPPGQFRLVGWFNRQTKAISGFLDRNAGRFFGLLDRIMRRLFKPPGTPNFPTGRDQVDWATGLRTVIVVMLVAGVGWLGWLGWRLWHGRRPNATKTKSTEEAAAPPDLTLEHVEADQLPEDDWLALARELAGRGDLRLAFRAVYLASLAHLARREFIRLAAFKTNRDYQREIARRARGVPDVGPRFEATAADFDRIWYGDHPASLDLVAQAGFRLEIIRRTAAV